MPPNDGYRRVNIYEMPQLPLGEEVTAILAESKNIRIERIISTGQVSDWYDQTETEFVILVEGEAAIEYADGKIINMSRGDVLLIEPHERHRVAYTSTDPPCIWLCIFYSCSI